MDTEYFIKRAQQVHGDKYDYKFISNPKSRDKVKIICPIHGEFEQKANSHLSGNGCKQCSPKKISKTKSLSFEKFVERCKKIHNDRYDYSLSNYINKTIPIEIIDKTNGLKFTQRPDTHLRGNKPQIFSNNLPLNTELFIKKSRKKHGDFYDYSSVKYTGAHNNIKIICPIHGEFEQSAHVHLSGCGCKQCSIDKRKSIMTLTTEKFIKRARKIHGDKFDYSLVKYTGAHNNIKIICPIHGEFEQSPSNHLRGCDCLECSKENTGYSQEKFIELANKTHNNKYDYKLIEYSGCRGILKIICPIHGMFNQMAYQHLQSNGCAKCANQYSTQHEMIKQFLIDQNIEFIENTRQIISPLELDFHIPEHNLAVEVNGLYWHSEARGKDENYHLNKTQLCLKQNIRLIHIFEDEFINDWNGVQQKLLNIFNKQESFVGEEIVLDVRWHPKCPDGYKIKETLSPNIFYFNKESRISENEFNLLDDKSGWDKIWDCGSIVVEKIAT